MSHTAARASARRSSSPAPPRWSFAPTMPVRAAVPTVHTRQGRRSHADIIGSGTGAGYGHGYGHESGSSRRREASPSPSPSPSPPFSFSSTRHERPSRFRDSSQSPSPFSSSSSSSSSSSPSPSQPSTPRSRNDSRAMHGLLSMESESDNNIDAMRSFVSSASRSRPVAPHLAQRHDQLLSRTGFGSGSGPIPAYPLHRMSNGSSTSSSSVSSSAHSSQHSSRANSMQSSPIQSPRQGNGNGNGNGSGNGNVNALASRVMSHQRSSSISSPSPSTPSHSQTRSHSPFPHAFCDEWHHDMLSQFDAVHEAMNSMWEDAVTMFAQPMSMHIHMPMIMGHSSPSNRPGTPTHASARASSQSQSQSQSHVRNIPIQGYSHPPQSPARSSTHVHNHSSSPASHSPSRSTSWIIPWYEHEHDIDDSALEDAMVWATFGRDDTGDIDAERLHHHPHHHPHHHHHDEDEDHIMDWFEQQGLPRISTPRTRSTHHHQVAEESWYPLDYDSLLRLDDGVKKVGVERHRLQRIQSQQRQPSRHELKEACQICLDEYSLSCRVVTLPVCAHLFHVECITKWLNENKTCPTCRNQLL